MTAPATPETLTDAMVVAVLRDDPFNGDAHVARSVMHSYGGIACQDAARQRICDAINARAKESGNG